MAWRNVPLPDVLVEEVDATKPPYQSRAEFVRHAVEAAVKVRRGA